MSKFYLYSTARLPDGIVIGGPWPETIVAWPNGGSRRATKVEYDLFQALEDALQQISGNSDGSSSLTERGLRALDSIKHCEYAMTPNEVTLDRRLRDTPPIEWTAGDVDAIVGVSQRINNRP